MNQTETPTLAPEPATVPKGRPAGFLTTVPGLLTALAGLLTAAAGAYLAFSGGSDAPRPAPVVVNMPTVGSPAPPAPQQVEPAQLRLDSAGNDLAGVSDDQRFLEEQATLCAEGDEDACIVVLDTLVDYCTDGSGPGCDALWKLSPEGSVYEAYGATCGARVSDEFAGKCAGL